MASGREGGEASGQGRTTRQARPLNCSLRLEKTPGTFSVSRSRLQSEPRLLVRGWHHPGRPLGWCRWRRRHFRQSVPDDTGHGPHEPHLRQARIYPNHAALSPTNSHGRRPL